MMYDIYNKHHVPFCGAFYSQRLAQPLLLALKHIKAHADAQINACILIKWLSMI